MKTRCSSCCLAIALAIVVGACSEPSAFIVIDRPELATVQSPGAVG